MPPLLEFDSEVSSKPEAVADCIMLNLDEDELERGDNDGTNNWCEYEGLADRAEGIMDGIWEDGCLVLNCCLSSGWVVGVAVDVAVDWVVSWMVGWTDGVT